MYEPGLDLIPKDLSFNKLQIAETFHDNGDILVGTTIERLVQSPDGTYIISTYTYLCDNDASKSLLNKVRYNASLTELPDMYQRN